MANGILGNASLILDTDTTLYNIDVADAKFTVFTVNLVNRDNATPALVRIAVSDTATPGNSEFIEYDTELLPSAVLERSGLIMQTGKYLIVRSNTSTVTATAYGIETATA
jgi:hypothetical protein